MPLAGTLTTAHWNLLALIETLALIEPFAFKANVAVPRRASTFAFVILVFRGEAARTSP